MFQIQPLSEFFLLFLFNCLDLLPGDSKNFCCSDLDVGFEHGVCGHDSLPGADSDEVAIDPSEGSYEHITHFLLAESFI